MVKSKKFECKEGLARAEGRDLQRLKILYLIVRTQCSMKDFKPMCDIGRIVFQINDHDTNTEKD